VAKKNLLHYRKTTSEKALALSTILSCGKRQQVCLIVSGEPQKHSRRCTRSNRATKRDCANNFQAMLKATNLRLRAPNLLQCYNMALQRYSETHSAIIILNMKETKSPPTTSMAMKQHTPKRIYPLSPSTALIPVRGTSISTNTLAKQ